MPDETERVYTEKEVYTKEEVQAIFRLLRVMSENSKNWEDENDRTVKWLSAKDIFLLLKDFNPPISQQDVDKTIQLIFGIGKEMVLSLDTMNGEHHYRLTHLAASGFAEIYPSL